MTSFWRRPTRLRSAETETEERHATWFELFFDLVFVLAIGQLTSIFTHDPTPMGFFEYAALFLPVWWAWVIYVTYADRFDTDDAVYRLIVMLGMLAILAMAVSLPQAFNADAADAAPFAIAYVIVRLVPLGLYMNAGRSLAIGREIAYGYGTATVPAAALWLIGLLFPTPARYVLWGAAALIEVANPLIRRRTVSRTPLAASHVSERFGLFTIIVLGEAVLSVGTTLGASGWHALPVLVGAAMFIVICAQWWLYFDFMDEGPLRRGFFTRELFVYAHLPIVVGITTIAAGTHLAIDEVIHGESHLSTAAVFAICGGAVLFDLATAAIHIAKHSARDWLVYGRVLVAAALLVLGVVGGNLQPLLLFAILAAIHVAQVIADLTLHGNHEGNEGVTHA